MSYLSFKEFQNEITKRMWRTMYHMAEAKFDVSADKFYWF
jgi:hypothetical protein